MAVLEVEFNQLTVDQFKLLLNSNNKNFSVEWSTADYDQEIQFQVNNLNIKERAAAVLVPIIVSDFELRVLLTLRSHNLKEHAGQVSFPGGQKEPDDKSIIDTALRESYEEVGLIRSDVEMICMLNPVRTLTNYLIRPVVGLVKGPYEFLLDRCEVAEIFEVPLSYFLNNENLQKETYQWETKQIPIYSYQYRDYRIWGATSLIIVDLIKRLSLKN